MKHTAILIGCLLLVASTMPTPSALADEELIAFAVVTELPKDKRRVPAKVSLDGSVSDMMLLASDEMLSNLAWKQLETCHALKLAGHKTSEGFLVRTVRAIDGAMLPMTLQGIEGDCLLKKALEVAPFVD